MIEADMAGKTWAMGDTFSAAPALFYADIVAPFGASHPNAAAYLRRLTERPSYARALVQAQPYLALMPK